MPDVEQLSNVRKICRLSVKELKDGKENIRSWEEGKHVADEIMKVMWNLSKKRKAIQLFEFSVFIIAAYMWSLFHCCGHYWHTLQHCMYWYASQVSCKDLGYWTVNGQ